MSFELVDRRFSRWQFCDAWCDDIVVYIAEGGRITRYSNSPSKPPLSAIYRWKSEIPEFASLLKLAYDERRRNKAYDRKIRSVNSFFRRCSRFKAKS